MQRITRSVLVVVGLVVGARNLAAQDHTLGLNLRVIGGSQVGLTILLSPALALRPSVSASWGSSEFTASTFETSSVSFDLDLLFRHATWDRVTLYSGPGVSVGYSNISIGEPSTVYGLRYQLGARLRVVDRVSLFAETGVSYRTSGPSGDESASIGTTNLGIIVFLK